MGRSQTFSGPLSTKQFSVDQGGGRGRTCFSCSLLDNVHAVSRIDFGRLSVLRCIRACTVENEGLEQFRKVATRTSGLRACDHDHFRTALWKSTSRRRHFWMIGSYEVHEAAQAPFKWQITFARAVHGVRVSLQLAALSHGMWPLDSLCGIQ